MNGPRFERRMMGAAMIAGAVLALALIYGAIPAVAFGIMWALA